MAGLPCRQPFGLARLPDPSRHPLRETL
jgi:hypothetical protein